MSGSFHIQDSPTMPDAAESLDICISNFILDAGYANKEVIFHSGNEQGMTIAARLPAKKGYPYKTFYHQAKSLARNKQVKEFYQTDSRQALQFLWFMVLFFGLSWDQSSVVIHTPSLF
jgi:hypothetical protein